MAEDHASWILYRRRNYGKIEIFHCLALYKAKDCNKEINLVFAN